MAQVINTNISSLNAQRNLNASQSSLATSLQRLSTGLRINSAKDDAAGLAIADRMTSQVQGLNQAARNANDGISLAQTAESGLSEVGASLQRMRVLSVQSANATNTTTDREALNAEVQQLLSEIQRVANTTQFNGQNILDGSFTAAQFQVGANANQTIIANTGDARTTSIGSFQINGGTQKVNGMALAEGDLFLNGIDVGRSANGTAEAIAATINAATPRTGVTASASTELKSDPNNKILANQSLQAGDMKINGFDIGAVASNSNVALQGQNIARAINAISNKTGVTAIADGGTGALTLRHATGGDIHITTAGTDATEKAQRAIRVENATGLEISGGAAGSTKTLGVQTLKFGEAVSKFQVAKFTASATADGSNPERLKAGDTFEVAGKTFRMVAHTTANADMRDSDIRLGSDGSAAANAASIVAAINLDKDIKGLVTAAQSTADVNLTANYAVVSTGANNGILSLSASNGIGLAVASTSDGAGLKLGSTVSVGGLTYEFNINARDVKDGNIFVQLGANTNNGAVTAENTELLTSANFVNALNANKERSTVRYVSGGITDTNVKLEHTLYGDDSVVAKADLKIDGSTTNAIKADAQTAGNNGTPLTNGIEEHGKLVLNSASYFTIDGDNVGKAGLNKADVLLHGVNKVDISTVEGANNAISLIDGALAQINSTRADMGALQNRFSSVVSSLTATSENLSAARSRIQDADFAQETAALTRAQILQQAGIAMLSQANALPQNVLSLLK